MNNLRAVGLAIMGAALFFAIGLGMQKFNEPDWGTKADVIEVMPRVMHKVVKAQDGVECWVVRIDYLDNTYQSIFKSYDVEDCKRVLRRLHDEN